MAGVVPQRVKPTMTPPRRRAPRGADQSRRRRLLRGWDFGSYRGRASAPRASMAIDTLGRAERAIARPNPRDAPVMSATGI
jgi:hypothetical protein